MALIFDSHAHYDEEAFDADRDALVSSMPAHGVGWILNSASDLSSSLRAKALAERFPFLYASAGVHPHEAKTLTDEALTQIEALTRHNKVVALGEIGLDYFYDRSPREVQRAAFERQLALARDLGLPVIIHSRDAHADTLEIVKRFRPKGVVHCFSGSAELAREYIRLGMYLGFTGAVTFRNARRPLEAARAVPLDRLLIETDCPYMAPEPFRGKRCDSTMLPRTVGTLAGVKGIEADTLIRETAKNAFAVYGIPLPMAKGAF
ncbi:MAG TPA: TatD family hydrolase [Candidatus Fimivivens faecavium]|nr:TatD family hydrolase [Candidatus Fimivivens faecavium]